MKFKDIPQFTKSANYRVNVSWGYLEDWIASHQEIAKGIAVLDLDPDFQRGHVWTEEQRKYVEYALRGGKAATTLLFNCAGWMRSFKGPFVLVDGKQRLTAVLKFLHNELPIFDGKFFKDFEDRLPFNVEFLVEVNDLKTRKEVLQWYLDLNAGGTVHTDEELTRVRALLNE